jgi:hypothetical protein
VLFQSLVGVYSQTQHIKYSMEQSPSCEANQSLLLVKKFPTFLWNPKVLYRTHKCPSPVPILSRLYPVPTTHSNFLKSILILSSRLRHMSNIDKNKLHRRHVSAHIVAIFGPYENIGTNTDHCTWV